jgi:hypothetical protein
MTTPTAHLEGSPKEKRQKSVRGVLRGRCGMRFAARVPHAAEQAQTPTTEGTAMRKVIAKASMAQLCGVYS